MNEKSHDWRMQTAASIRLLHALVDVTLAFQFDAANL